MMVACWLTAGWLQACKEAIVACLPACQRSLAQQYHSCFERAWHAAARPNRSTQSLLGAWKLTTAGWSLSLLPLSRSCWRLGYTASILSATATAVSRLCIKSPVLQGQLYAVGATSSQRGPPCCVPSFASLHAQR